MIIDPGAEHQRIEAHVLDFGVEVADAARYLDVIRNEVAPICIDNKRVDIGACGVERRIRAGKAKFSSPL